jgi:hypothetical protein
MNNRITNVLINRGITLEEVAYRVLLHYKRTGKIIDIRL